MCVSASSKFPAPDASWPNAFRTDDALSTAPDTSVSLISANFTNLVDRSSRSSPVSPNLVCTSPTASAAVWKSVGTVSAMPLATFWSPVSSSPDAPVFVAIVSIASSTSFQAAVEAAAIATTGAVTPFVSAVPAPSSFWPHSASCVECVFRSSLTSSKDLSYLFSCVCALTSSERFFAIAS